MVLHTCTIKLNNNKILKCKTVEQSLGIIESEALDNISNVILDVEDGTDIKTYQHLTLEESIESLMNL
ncbi:hypothetical protein [Vibrio marisflavi]|uniref:Uncharacterized protein n=1 Tax=Vibrio marisflavi CECT 7928 TaxID=634439 RepID=A0ABN8E323_9VIBR|nr:hypothetical protein [Vibrio marisflavi]CAH0536215.1 hypothetical protein VMF7928_00277 [Vibrio marisflavi CECT 7928]